MRSSDNSFEWQYWNARVQKNNVGDFSKKNLRRLWKNFPTKSNKYCSIKTAEKKKKKAIRINKQRTSLIENVHFDFFLFQRNESQKKRRSVTLNT